MDIRKGKPFFLFVFIVIFFIDKGCPAQDLFSVSDPELSLKDNIVHIAYDILRSDPADEYRVSLNVVSAEGKEIKVRSVGGDIGSGIRGGEEKTITWDFLADQVEPNTEIVVTVSAEKMPSQVKEDTPAPETIPASELTASSSISRTSLMIQSLALPGLGLSRITGKPHWIKGIAGYGCLAGSVALNRMAINTYEDFRNSSIPEDAATLLDQSTRQDNFSEVLAYTAIGVWVSDIIWTLIRSSESNRFSSKGSADRVRFLTQVDPVTGGPLVGINYRFK